MKRFRGQKIYLLARRYPSATERLVLTKKQNQTNKPKICKFIPILPFYSPFLYFSVLYIYIFIFLWTFETKITHLNKIYIFFSMNMRPRKKYISKLSDLSLSLLCLYYHLFQLAEHCANRITQQQIFPFDMKIQERKTSQTHTYYTFDLYFPYNSIYIYIRSNYFRIPSSTLHIIEREK